jgi:hypothetical protein
MQDINKKIQEIINTRSCCSGASVRVADLRDREKSFFNEYMPESVTAIALLHHVTLKRNGHGTLLLMVGRDALRMIISKNWPLE